MKTKKAKSAKTVKKEVSKKEVSKKVKINKDDFRVCSCGRTVKLPEIGSTEPTICECGIKHIR